MISKSAPRPVIDPPTPAAKYSPPWLVSHLPFALLSSRSVTLPKISLYSLVFIKLRTLLPNLDASSALWETCIIFFFGYFPIYQAGNKLSKAFRPRKPSTRTSNPEQVNFKTIMRLSVSLAMR
jgi:hypothetical protein